MIFPWISLKVPSQMWHKIINYYSLKLIKCLLNIPEMRFLIKTVEQVECNVSINLKTTMCQAVGYRVILPPPHSVKKTTWKSPNTKIHTKLALEQAENNI